MWPSVCGEKACMKLCEAVQPLMLSTIKKPICNAVTLIITMSMTMTMI